MARQVYQSNINDASGDEYFKCEKYTTQSASSSTANWDSDVDGYFLSITDEASGDVTYDPSTVTNPSYAFDGNDATYADKDSNAYLGKTFASARYIGATRIKVTTSFSGSGSNGTCSIILKSYNGSTWATLKVLATSASGTSGDASFDGYYYVNDTIQGLSVELIFSPDGGGSAVHRWYTIAYGDFDESDTVTETSVFSKNPNGLVIYASKLTPTNTSITVDISDDGGSTWEITGQSFDTPIDTTSLAGSNIALKFNLATTNEETTPILYGWSAVILNT